ncbi:syntaxin-4 isoform X1 [Tursiops truncatus]|uniref:syntaxin-4 isoform X1 n=2 Tax=Tursiops truncatus TaxID=9739 RepID=UPI003CCF9E12
MRDRTHELRQGDDSSDDEDKERVALVVHPGTARLGSPDDEFFQKVRTIRQTIVKLENKVRELEKQQVTILATPLPEESMKQDLQNLRDEIKQLGRDIRAQLKAIEPQKEEADENYNSVNTRMRKTQHGVLSQQFVELINKCNSMQSEYREKNVERIRRQLKITNAGMVSDEELEQMLDSGQSEVFVSNILKDTQVTRQALNEISARHSEIQQLERSIRELHEIFTFLATEVEMQGETINRIEKNILSSADYVERGQEHVKMALESQKKARKVTAAAPVAQPVWLQYRSLRPPSMGCTRGCRGDASDEGLAVWSLVQTRTRPWTRDGGGVRGRDWAPVTWDRTAQPPSVAGRPPAAPPCGPRMAVARCVRQIRGYTWPRVYGVWLKGSPVATWKTTD